MTDATPEPPEEAADESWDQMAQRVTAEEVNTKYAQQLMGSMECYIVAGFSHQQAWELLLAEHQSRLDFMGQAALSAHEDGA